MSLKFSIIYLISHCASKSLDVAYVFLTKNLRVQLQDFHTYFCSAKSSVVRAFVQRSVRGQTVDGFVASIVRPSHGLSGTKKRGLVFGLVDCVGNIQC